MIEVELRTFITKEEYNNLITKFKNIITTKQITYYFKGEKDFRIMFMEDKTKMWLKEGNIHDESRKEYEVFTNKENNKELLNMLHSLGYIEEIKWFRIRNKTEYKGITITIDYTEGYGYIIEGEILVENNSDIDKAKEKIKNLFKELNINICSKKEFSSKYEDYKQNWNKYTENIDEKKFLSTD